MPCDCSCHPNYQYAASCRGCDHEGDVSNEKRRIKKMICAEFCNADRHHEVCLWLRDK